MGKAADAIVSRIGSHVVVTIIMKPIIVEQRLSALNTHLREFMNVVWSIANREEGENHDAEEEA